MAAVDTTVQDGVIVITILRPEARNAINGEAARIIADAIARLDDDDDLRVGVLTGSGGSFSAGMDLKAFLAGEEISLDGRGLAGLCEVPPTKPLVAAVDGWALAGGFEMVLACDLVVAARGSRFGLPEVKRGLVAGAGGVMRLPEALPLHLAREMILTGDPVDAETAHRHGLVNRLTEPGEALPAALELARTIASNGPLALAATKRVLDESPGWGRAERFARQWEVIGPVFDSEDAREGAQAFAEKRPPVWRGR